jgi:hypothetical protein
MEDRTEGSIFMKIRVKNIRRKDLVGIIFSLDVDCGFISIKMKGS